MLKIFIIDSCRLSNFEGSSLLEKVSKVWDSAKNYTGIKYGVYHDYESNYKGDYTLTVGTEDYFNKLETMEIANNKYKIFDVDTSNKFKNPILETWKLIWRLEERGLLERNYILDFEKFHLDGKIEIYIGIKS